MTFALTEANGVPEPPDWCFETNEHMEMCARLRPEAPAPPPGEAPAPAGQASLTTR